MKDDVKTGITERRGGGLEPPVTQEKYNSFQSKIPVMKDGMKPEVTERRGGGSGTTGNSGKI